MASNAAHELSEVPRTELGPDAWDGFVDANSAGWLWHRYDYMEALATWPGREDRSTAILGSSGQPLAVLPVQVVTRRLGPWRVRRLDVPSGPVVSDDVAEGATAAVRQHIARRLRVMAWEERAIGVVCSLSAVAPAYRDRDGLQPHPLADLGLRPADRETWALPLCSSKEDVWSIVRPGGRQGVRAARRAEVTVRLGSEDDQAVWYDLHVVTCERTGARPHPEGYFGLVWKKFVRVGLASLLVAEIRGRAVGVACVARYKGAGSFWMGASDDDGLASSANYLLQWTAIEDMVESGCEVYELGEAHDASAGKQFGISEFKRKFASERRTLPRAEWRRRGTALAWTAARRLGLVS